MEGDGPARELGPRIKGAVGNTRELSARTLRKAGGLAAQTQIFAGGSFDPSQGHNFDSRDLLHTGTTAIFPGESLDPLRVSGVSNRTTVTPIVSTPLPFTPLSISTPLSMSGLDNDNEFDRVADDDYVDEGAGNTFLNPALSLDEHTGAVTRLRVPRRTSLLLSASVDGTLRIWGPGETESRAVLDATNFMLPGHETNRERKISLGTRDDNTLDSLTGSSGGGGVRIKIMNMWAQEACETIWCAGNDCALRVWGGAEGKALRFLKGHEDAVTVMEGMSGIGGLQSSCLVGTGSADRTVRIWDARAKRAQIFLFKGHSDTVLAMRWGEGGRSVMSAGKDKTIRIWDTRTGR